MTERALEEVGRLLSRRVGLRLDPAIRGRLRHAVRDEAARLGLEPESYASSLERDADQLQALLNRVTVQETSFFRDPGQFDALRTDVLPELLAAGGRVEVWSAGCANGQEPYSLAMALDEAGIRDWHVTATDISTVALERTRAGRYRERELRGLSAEQRSQHLTRLDDDTWEVAAPLRARVTTVRNNLAADPLPASVGGCQVVFCRNVLIYFGHDDVVAFLDRLARRLPPTAYLFLGYSESLWQVTDRFRLVRLGDAFAYRPTTGADAVEPPPATPRPVVRAPAPIPAPPRVREPRPQRQPVPEPEPAPDVPALLADGEAALDRGDHAAAVAAFRKAVYLDPDHPVVHLNLGLALETAGDVNAARRAYAVGRAALDRCDTAAVESTLEGYHLDDLVRLLDRKAAGR
jgi:chemotaxis protein methyltransferase CheR